MRAHDDRRVEAVLPSRATATGSPIAGAILRLQRDAGNRAVAEVLQRKGPAPAASAKAPAAAFGPPVPVIGPVPTSVSSLPKADPDGKAQPLGETTITGSTAPSFDVVPAAPATPAANDAKAKPKGYTAKVAPTQEGEIQIEARYPAPDKTYPVGKFAVLIEPEVADRIRDGEQEHSNDHYLASHQVNGVVAAAINRLAAKAPHTATDRDAARAYWRMELAAELPAQLRAPATDQSPNGPWMGIIAMLHGLSDQRDTNGWHNMIFRGPLQDQVRKTKVAKGLELRRVYPSGNIGEKGSQDRIDAVAPWLKRARR